MTGRRSELDRAWRRVLDEVRDFPEEIRDRRVCRPASREEVRGHVEETFGGDAPGDIEQITGDAIECLRRWTVHVTSPRYFGLFNPSVLEPAILGDVLAAVYNLQLAAWSHAPAACEMERFVLGELGRCLDLPPEASHAAFTTGGAEANLSAVLAALADRVPEALTAGIEAAPGRPTLYVSESSHDSFVKIARMTGLGTDALRTVPPTPDLRMDPDALDRKLSRDTEAGRLPLAVVATAGTTAGGIIDPLDEVAEVARRHGAWYHVDAAWGGAAAISPELRPLIAGIERADSVTWDAHKWLSVPMGAGMFFCRHPEAVRRAFSVSTGYMPGETGERPDPYASTVQWSRRAIGLKVFLSWVALGRDGYAELIEHQTEMGDLLRDELESAGWRIVNDTPLPVVCFSHPDLEAGDTTVADVLDRIYERGEVWISSTVLREGRDPVLRACVTSYRTDAGDVGHLVRELERTRTELTA